MTPDLIRGKFEPGGVILALPPTLRDAAVMVRCPAVLRPKAFGRQAVLRGSGFALAPQDDGRASNHGRSSG
jgi:hypothetical protein